MPAPVTPVVVHDGLDEPGVAATAPVLLPCPVCGSDVEVDAAEVVRRGRPVAASHTDVDRSLQDALLQRLPLRQRTIDDLRVLRDDDGLGPHVLESTCACGTVLLIVVTAGEVQPARWRTTVHGLVPAPS